MLPPPSVPPHRRSPRFQPSLVCPPPVLRPASHSAQFSLYPPLPLRRAATATHSFNRSQQRNHRPIGSPPDAALSAHSTRPRPRRLQLSALVAPPRDLPSFFFQFSLAPCCHASGQSFYPIRKTIAHCRIRIFRHFPPHAPVFSHSPRRAVFAQRRSARFNACASNNSFTVTSFPTLSLVYCSFRRTVFGHRRIGRSVVNSFFLDPSAPHFSTASSTSLCSTSFSFSSCPTSCTSSSFYPPLRSAAHSFTLADATADNMPGFSFSHSSAVAHSCASAFMPLLPPPSTTPPLFPLASCSAPPLFSADDGVPHDSGNSACTFHSHSSLRALSSSMPTTGSLVSTVSSCCAAATIAPLPMPCRSADLLHPLPPVPRLQRAWDPPVSHLPGGTRYSLRLEPAFGGRSKKKDSFDRGPDRCFSSSGGGVGSGYWRSHRPQKQRGQLHARRRHSSLTAAFNSASSSTTSSTSSVIVSTSSPSPFQKRRDAYERFYNATILSFPPVIEPEHTEFFPTFPCYPPAPLHDPATVPRPLRVPMPTLCRLDFGLPLPPPPPRERPSSSHLLFSFPPPPVPPPPPFPPGPPRFAEQGGGVRFWLSRLDRNRQAHAENGNTTSCASAPSLVSSSQSQSHFRSFLFSIPATSIPNHFDWFRDRFDWAVIRYACVGCRSDSDGPSEYEGYVQLDNSRSLHALSTRFGHSSTFLPVPSSFTLSTFQQQFPPHSFLEIGSPHRVHSSPLHRTSSVSSPSVLSQLSPMSSPATGSQSRRWSSLTLSPNAAATFQTIASVPTCVPSNEASLTPPASPVASSGDPHEFRGSSRYPRSSSPERSSGDASLISPTIPVGPPRGFRGFPVLPRHAQTTPRNPLQITGVTREGPLPPSSLHSRGRSSSPLPDRCPRSSLSACLASDKRPSSAPCPLFQRSPVPTASALASSSGRPSSTARRLLFQSSPQSFPEPLLRPFVASSSVPDVTHLSSPPHRSGVSIRPTRASFVEPDDDPGAPGEALPSNPRDRIRYVCFTENNPTKSLEDFVMHYLHGHSFPISALVRNGVLPGLTIFKDTWNFPVRYLLLVSKGLCLEPIC